MTHKKGQEVYEKDFEGRVHRLVVWQDAGAIVYVTSSEVFERLQRGVDSLWPIGHAKKSISET